MTTSVDRFAAAAQAYCTWSESGAEDDASEARTAVRHLSILYALALDLCLREEADSDLDGVEVDDDAWKTVYARHHALPFDYYWEVGDPHSQSPGEPLCGDLADDLADIYRDLREGLSLFQEGHAAEAETAWFDCFQFHWGLHATQALSAIHRWFAGDRSRWTA